MKKFLVVMLMLMMLCIVGCDGKKAEGASTVVIYGETMGRPISDKSTYTLLTDDNYAKLVDDKTLFCCREVDGQIVSMAIIVNRVSSYEVAMTVTLKLMDEYASEYNNGVYYGHSKNLFMTRYKGNNTVTAAVERADDGYWRMAVTYQKLSKDGLSDIKYDPDYE